MSKPIPKILEGLERVNLEMAGIILAAKDKYNPLMIQWAELVTSKAVPK